MCGNVWRPRGQGQQSRAAAAAAAPPAQPAAVAARGWRYRSPSYSTSTSIATFSPTAKSTARIAGSITRASCFACCRSASMPAAGACASSLSARVRGGEMRRWPERRLASGARGAGSRCRGWRRLQCKQTGKQRLLTLGSQPCHGNHAPVPGVGRRAKAGAYAGDAKHLQAGGCEWQARGGRAQGPEAFAPRRTGVTPPRPALGSHPASARRRRWWGGAMQACAAQAPRLRCRTWCPEETSGRL